MFCLYNKVVIYYCLISIFVYTRFDIGQFALLVKDFSLETRLNFRWTLSQYENINNIKKLWSVLNYKSDKAASEQINVF